MEGMNQFLEVNDLADRVLMLTGGSGERAPFFLRAEDTFMAGQPSIGRLSYNVPVDADFYGERLNLYFQYRIVNVASVAQSDVAFRPCDWSSRADMFLPVSPQVVRQGNVMLELSDGVNGAYQSSPFNVAGVFSSPYGTAGGALGAAVTLYVGALEFPIPYVIRKGVAAQLSVTTLFNRAYPLVVAGDFRAEFRVVSEFTGYKNVRAFR